MMQSYQADPIMHLQQKLRNLVLKSKIQKVASTQTEAITGELQTRSNSQSMEEIMKEKVINYVKAKKRDKELYARIQFEKRMKDDMKLEVPYSYIYIQYLKEEHQRQLHSMALLHTTEIKEQESAYKEDVKRLQGRIEYLQARKYNDLATTRALNDLISHQLEESREKEGKSAGALGRAEQEILELKRDVTSLAEYRRNYQLDVDAENLKKEIEKYKEINEIVMSEFTKVERERDELLSEFNKNLNRIEQVNIRKHKEIKSRIHEIKRKYSLDEYAFGT
uniref:Coiled-coil domain-containing protein 146 n=1 Tax=Heterorhabditis bacteriophora TaxID=37862 RepID=A0A1I7XNV0_HETBA